MQLCSIYFWDIKDIPLESKKWYSSGFGLFFKIVNRSFLLFGIHFSLIFWIVLLSILNSFSSLASTSFINCSLLFAISFSEKSERRFRVSFVVSSLFISLSLDIISIFLLEILDNTKFASSIFLFNLSLRTPSSSQLQLSIFTFRLS